MDSFCEQIVKKKKGAKEWAVILLTLVVGLGLVLASLRFAEIFIIVAVGVGYGAWWLISAQSSEFEYCVTNGSIDVDRIIARRKRVRMVSVSGHKLETLRPLDPSDLNKKYDRRVMVAPSMQEEGLWTFTYRSKRNGYTLVVFQPDQRVLWELRGGLTKLVQRDTDAAAKSHGIEITAPVRED